jgi:iron uptake system component EfeO
MFRTSTMSAALLAVAAVPLLGACTGNTPAADARTVSVTSTATACQVSATSAPSGSLTFKVTNGGSDVTEFYLLAGDGVRVVGEVENVGPGLTRELVVQAQPGDYVTQCKPGMTGDGIKAPFTVTDSGASIAVSSQPVDEDDDAVASASPH